MGKASYKIRETKNMRHFTYSGNLKDAIEKAKRDLQKEKENKEIAQWYWLYEKAKKAINTHNKKIANIEAFIRCAEEEQDEAAVRGVIANKPTYRETPRGKRITDITVKVRNELTGGSCFLPCICWQEQADEAAQWQQGDTVELLGRYQSLQYEKVLDAATGEREQLTAYEVSVRLIRRKEEAENEC